MREVGIVIKGGLLAAQHARSWRRYKRLLWLLWYWGRLTDPGLWGG